MNAFLHIPKTAGTSMRSMFQQTYPGECFFSDEWVDGNRMITNPEEFSRFKIVGGHLYPYFFQNLDIKHFLIVFRHPVSRRISDYEYILRTPNHPMHAQALKHSLKDLLKIDKWVNAQCMFVCNAQSSEKAIETLSTDPRFLFGTLEEIHKFTQLLRFTLNIPAILPNLNAGTKNWYARETVEAIKEVDREDLLLWEWVTKQIIPN